MSSFLQDLRFGARLLVRSPGFTAMAVFALALGIGGSTAIFSAVNATLLQPLPYPHSERLVRLWETKSTWTGSVSAPNFLDWEAQSTSFEAMTAVRWGNFSFTSEGEPERLMGMEVSASYFRTIGVEPSLGRSFTAEEYAPGHGQVVVLDDLLWRRRFNADQGVVGKPVVFGGRTYTIVGVMPPGFTFGHREQGTRLWFPLDFEGRGHERGSHMLQVYGRLKGDKTLAAARVELDTIGKRIAQQYPEEQTGRGVLVRDLQEVLTEDVRDGFLVLLGAVALVLLIACANVAGLLLARGASRSGELAVRLALGASQWRIVRQLLTESLLLGAVGGGIGALVALWGTDLLDVGFADKLPLRHVSVDGPILCFCAALTVMSAVLFGLWPAVAASRASLQEGLKDSAARATTGPGRNRARRLLVVVELAASLALLAGSGLMIQSYVKLTGVDPGFDATNLLTVRIGLHSPRYTETTPKAAFFRQLWERIGALPGVASVGVVNDRPFSDSNWNGGYYIEGRPAPKPGEEWVTEYLVVNPDYFRTMKIPFIKGRTFSTEEIDGERCTVVINQAMEREQWPNGDSLGKRISYENENEGSRCEIIGVVGNVHRWGFSRGAVPESYRTYPHFPTRTMSLMVRTHGDPLKLLPALRAELRQIDPDVPLYDVQTMEQVLSDSVSELRFNVQLLVLFAAMAVVLASVGIYGLMSYQVSQRTREMGIRMALGATAQSVRAMVLKEGGRLVAWGIGAGLLGAFALSRTLRSLLYGVAETDPWTFGGVAVLLALVALAATYLPARRASLIDPMSALRYQ